MRPGDIIYFDSHKVVGRESRHKYHVYVGPGGWIKEGYAFLFINKSDNGGCFEINKDDYPFLIYPNSFIGCSYIVPYREDELKSTKIDFKGRLLDRHLRALRIHISDCDTLTGHEIKLILDCLKQWA